MCQLQLSSLRSSALSQIPSNKYRYSHGVCSTSTGFIYSQISLKFQYAGLTILLCSSKFNGKGSEVYGAIQDSYLSQKTAKLIQFEIISQNRKSRNFHENLIMENKYEVQSVADFAVFFLDFEVLTLTQNEKSVLK